MPTQVHKTWRHAFHPTGYYHLHFLCCHQASIILFGIRPTRQDGWLLTSSISAVNYCACYNLYGLFDDVTVYCCDSQHDMGKNVTFTDSVVRFFLQALQILILWCHWLGSVHSASQCKEELMTTYLMAAASSGTLTVTVRKLRIDEVLQNGISLERCSRHL